VLQSGAELRRKLSVCDEDETDHENAVAEERGAIFLKRRPIASPSRES
jgi:hypothetical protein